jgi:hypothetical protein
MQHNQKEGSVAGYAIVTILAVAFGIWEAYGTYQCDKGLATHRAWVGQVILGYGLIALAFLVSLPALFLVRDRKKVVFLMVSSIGIGLTPTVVHWLLGPTCRLLNLY